MVKTTCYVCKASKAQPCKECGAIVCKSHRDLYFNEGARDFSLLCHNCGKKAIMQVAPAIRPRRSWRGRRHTGSL